MKYINKLLIYIILAYVVITSVYAWYTLINNTVTTNPITTNTQQNQFRDFRSNQAQLDFARRPLGNPSPELQPE